MAWKDTAEAERMIAEMEWAWKYIWGLSNDKYQMVMDLMALGEDGNNILQKMPDPNLVRLGKLRVLMQERLLDL